jgi:hypothetical protein
MYLDSEAVLVECADKTQLFVRNVRDENLVNTRKNTKKPLDVLIIYLDAVSRLFPLFSSLIFIDDIFIVDFPRHINY